MSTIQVDFQLPQRFEMEYSGDDNARHRPVMIHRALFGSVERFFGVLTEHYAGAFPLWLAPEQLRFVRSPTGTSSTARSSPPGPRTLDCEPSSTTPRKASARRSARHSSPRRRTRSWWVIKELESDAYTVRDRAGTEFTGVTFDRVVDALVAEDSSRRSNRPISDRPEERSWIICGARGACSTSPRPARSSRKTAVASSAPCRRESRARPGAERPGLRGAEQVPVQPGAHADRALAAHR